jgi:hypothetical protein
MTRSEPRVYNLNMTPDQPGVYIGRRGKGQEGRFGNPVILGVRCPICWTIHKNDWLGREAACACYEIHLRRRLALDHAFAVEFDKLNGNNLLCFCAPRDGLEAATARRSCHGQVILSVLAERCGIPF